MLVIYDKSLFIPVDVMLVEIPDPDVILSVVTAFCVGLFSLFVYYKVKPYINVKRKDMDPTYFERLEYYERQLIDMKIRLDALEIDDLGTKMPPMSEDIVKKVKDLPSVQVESPKEEPKVPEPPKDERMPNLGYKDAIDHVLGLITNKAMTSRDIQVTIGRTREHTSRLMKKLFEDGYVQRNTNTKPYTYSITDKGREKLGLVQTTPTTA